MSWLTSIEMDVLAREQETLPEVDMDIEPSELKTEKKKKGIITFSIVPTMTRDTKEPIVSDLRIEKEKKQKTKGRLFVWVTTTESPMRENVFSFLSTFDARNLIHANTHTNCDLRTFRTKWIEKPTITVCGPVVDAPTRRDCSFIPSLTGFSFTFSRRIESCTSCTNRVDKDVFSLWSQNMVSSWLLCDKCISSDVWSHTELEEIQLDETVMAGVQHWTTTLGPMYHSCVVINILNTMTRRKLKHKYGRVFPINRLLWRKLRLSLIHTDLGVFDYRMEYITEPADYFAPTNWLYLCDTYPLRFKYYIVLNVSKTTK
jgi:hypothetical protein